MKFGHRFFKWVLWGANTFPTHKWLPNSTWPFFKNCLLYFGDQSHRKKDWWRLLFFFKKKLTLLRMSATPRHLGHVATTTKSLSKKFDKTYIIMPIHVLIFNSSNKVWIVTSILNKESTDTQKDLEMGKVYLECIV